MEAALVEALWDDPFYAAVNLDGPEDALAGYFRASIAEARLVGRVDSLGPEGAALWITSSDPALLESARIAKLEDFARILGSRGLRNYMIMVAGMEARLEGLLPKAMWYLSILGVAPEHQGRGLGVRLLEPVLSLGQASYLETFGQRSLRFYERLGYETRAEFHEPVTGLPYWVMVRNGGLTV